MNWRDLLGLSGRGSSPREQGPEAGADPSPEDADEPQPQGTAPDPMAPILIQVASRAAAVAGDNESYFWHDDRTLLFLRPAPQPPGFRAVLVDAVTGRRTKPTEFNDRSGALLQGTGIVAVEEGSSPGEASYIPPKAALSPDGEWLLWSRMRLPTLREAITQSPPSTWRQPGVFFRSEWVAAAVDGRQEMWPTSNDPATEVRNLPGHGLWLLDGKRWVELVRCLNHDVYTIHLAHEYRLGGSAPVRTVQITGLADGLAAGIRQDGAVVMHMPWSSYTSGPFYALSLSVVSLREETATAETPSIPVPAANGAHDVTLSPQGDRLAWMLQMEYGETQLYTIYSADADGASLRPLGAAEAVERGDGWAWPRDLAWLPDGKRVSFRYGRSIYTIPV